MDVRIISDLLTFCLLRWLCKLHTCLFTQGSTDLAVVAPGIAEALIATAAGLFAAIPAVVAYNRFSHDVDRLAVRFESFMEEFLNILQRQAHNR